MAQNETKIIQHVNLDDNEIRNSVIPQVASSVDAKRGKWGVDSDNRLWISINNNGNIKIIKFAQLSLENNEQVIRLTYNTIDGEQRISLDLETLAAKIIDDSIATTSNIWSAKEVLDQIQTAIDNLGVDERIPALMEAAHELIISEIRPTTANLPPEDPGIPLYYLYISEEEISYYTLSVTSGATEDDPDILAWTRNFMVKLGSTKSSRLTITGLTEIDWENGLATDNNGVENTDNITWEDKYGPYPDVYCYIDTGTGTEELVRLNVSKNTTTGSITIDATDMTDVKVFIK